MRCACSGSTAGTVTLTGTRSRTGAGQPSQAASSAQASQRAHSRGPYSPNGENSAHPAGPSISAPSRTVMPRNRVRIGIANARSPGSAAATRSRGPGTASATKHPPGSSLILPDNLTTMTSRPLHAVLLPAAAGAGRLMEALGAALDGTGPALLPVDPRLPAGRVQALLQALRPATLETPDGPQRLDPGDSPGVAPGTAVVIATSGSTGEPKGVELSAAALRHSARASLARIGARPGEAWLSCLPPSHISGLQVFVRSLLSGVSRWSLTG